MGVQLKPKPQCGCGNTQNPNGYCDGSHNKTKDN
jgi:CDGSH-type Zn-finger protein